MKMPSQENYAIRPLNTGDVEQYNALLRYAFQITEQELSECGWQDDEIKQSKFPVLERADVLGCFDGNDLVSQIAGYPLKMNIYGVVYPSASAASGPAVSVFHPAVPQNGVGDHLQQDFLYR